MSAPQVHERRRDTLHLRIGEWFEATASGWGVVAAALVLALVLAASLLGRLLV